MKRPRGLCHTFFDAVVARPRAGLFSRGPARTAGGCLVTRPSRGRGLVFVNPVVARPEPGNFLSRSWRDRGQVFVSAVVARPRPNGTAVSRTAPSLFLIRAMTARQSWPRPAPGSFFRTITVQRAWRRPLPWCFLGHYSQAAKVGPLHRYFLRPLQPSGRVPDRCSGIFSPVPAGRVRPWSWRDHHPVLVRDLLGLFHPWGACPGGRGPAATRYFFAGRGATPCVFPPVSRLVTGRPFWRGHLTPPPPHAGVHPVRWHPKIEFWRRGRRTPPPLVLRDSGSL